MGAFLVTWGIIAVLGSVLAFIPGLLMLTWLVIPLAAVGLMFGTFTLSDVLIRTRIITSFFLNVAALIITVIHIVLILIFGGSRLFYLIIRYSNNLQDRRVR